MVTEGLSWPKRLLRGSWVGGMSSGVVGCGAHCMSPLGGLHSEGVCERVGGLSWGAVGCGAHCMSPLGGLQVEGACEG